MTKFDFSYFWASALRFHATTSIALHGITLYLCVVMAFIRWKAMRTIQNIFMKNPRIVWYIFGSITIAVTAMCVPTYLVHEVKLIKYQRQSGTFMEVLEYYTVDISDYALENRCEVFKANLWIIGIFLKVTLDLKKVNTKKFQAIPCFLLLWFTSALMFRLHKNNVKRAMLLYSKSNKGARKMKRNYDRTTFTLIVVLTVFLVSALFRIRITQNVLISRYTL